MCVWVCVCVCEWVNMTIFYSLKYIASFLYQPLPHYVILRDQTLTTYYEHITYIQYVGKNMSSYANISSFSS